jgi:hypothetical protein
VHIKLQQLPGSVHAAPGIPHMQMSAAQTPLQHSEFAKQPPLGRQQPPSEQDCCPVQSVFETQPLTGGTQKPPMALPVQQVAAELVGPEPMTQQLPPSQPEPAQQSLEVSHD